MSILRGQAAPEPDAAGTSGLLARVAHDLRRPLTVVVGYLETLDRMDDLLDDATRRRFIERALQASRRQARMIEALLDHHVFGSGVVRGEPEPMALDAEVGRILLEHVPPDARQRVEIDVPPATTVWADRASLDSVLANLMANALRVAEGPVRVEARSDGGEVVVSVSDDGPGVDPEARERIFEPFVTTDPGGLGLGLSIAREASKSLGGSLWIEETSPDGTRFSFTLPAPEVGERSHKFWSTPQMGLPGRDDVA